MFKFNIGDKIQLKDHISSDDTGNYGTHQHNLDEVRKHGCVTVTDIFPKDDVGLDMKIDESLDLYWNSDWFEYGNILPNELFEI